MTAHEPLTKEQYKRMTIVLFVISMSFLLFDFTKQSVKDLGYGPLFIVLQRLLGIFGLFVTIKHAQKMP